MNIVVSANNNENILIFPIVPKEPQLQIPSNNEEFETINGKLNLIGNIGLKKISLSSIFPKNKEPWASPGSVEAERYIKFFNKYRTKKIPIRLIITKSNGSEWINMPVLIENFNYSIDKNKENVRYTLDLKEYRYISKI